MKSYFRGALVLLYVLAVNVLPVDIAHANGSSTCYSIETVPNPKTAYGGLVSDPGTLLDQFDRARIDTQLKRIESATTVQFAVVILQSIGGENIDEFAPRLFKKWGIGQASKDNGLLLLLVIDQRAWRLETGYGLEGVLTDALCGTIGRNNLVPFLKKGMYGEGIYQTVFAISRILNNPEDSSEIYEPIRTSSTISDSSNISIVIFFLIVGLLMAAITFFFVRSLKNIIKENKNPYEAYKKVSELNFFIYLSIVFIILPVILGFVISLYRKKFRYQPRLSASGKPMMLLDEKNDDKYLSTGSSIEEKIKSVDYDVWITDDASEKQILSYERAWTKYTRCSKCSFKTNSLESSITITKATTSRSGEAIDTYLCCNCGAESKRNRIIPRIEKTSSSSSSGGSSRSSSFSGGRSGGGGASGNW